MSRNRKMNVLSRFAVLSLLLFAAGCASSGGDTATSDEPSSAQAMSAAEIRSALADKSWRFQGPNNTGTTLYAEDGSSLVEVDGKGTTKGKWTTKDGQLCESFDPAPFLPGGVPMSCYPFSKGGSPNTYQAGKATFTAAS